MARTTRGMAAAFPLTLLALALPTAASAATVGVAGGGLRLSAGAGESNDIRIDYRTESSNRIYAIRDDKVALTAVGPSCVATGVLGQVDCTVPIAGETNPLVSLGDGSDEAIVSNGPNVVAQVLGGDGNDDLRGFHGRQRIDGGNGDDYMRDDAEYFDVAPPSADELIGGPGWDLADYARRPGPIVASLDGLANDGHAGEQDNVHADVESLYGTENGPNELTGNAGPNGLRGGFRSDVLVGGGGDDGIGAQDGNDGLDGGDGNDKLYGHDGHDVLLGRAGDDLLEAGSGNDRLDGGGGVDSLIGDVATGAADVSGNDTILARDGIGESISCGPGSDTATIDLTDVVPSDPVNACEVVDRAAGPPSRPTAFVSIAATSLRVKKRAVRIKLTCRRATPCAGRLTLRSAKQLRVKGRKRTLTLGRASFRIAAGRSKTFKVKLGRAARTALRAKRRIKVVVTAKGKDGSTRKALTLRIR